MNKIASILIGFSLIAGALPAHAAPSLSAALTSDDYGWMARNGLHQPVKGSASTVYYLDENNNRFVFPDSKTYFTWFKDFSFIETKTDADLARAPFKGNVTYRPGVRLLKLVTAPTVYAVSFNHVLRPIGSESVAIALYGANWNKLVDDLPESFFVNYTVGAPIVSANDFNVSTESNAWNPVLSGSLAGGALVNTSPVSTATVAPHAMLVGPTALAGRIQSVAADPRNENIAYAGSASGGIFKTTDRGLTWQSIADKQTALHISAISIDPTDSNTVYVGTGEMYEPGDEYAANGIYVSHDAGKTWDGGITYQTGSVEGVVSAIVIDPRDPLHVYAATSKGVYETKNSTDIEVGWKKIADGFVENLIMLKNTPDILVATGANTLIMRTTDGGKTWQKRAGYDIQSGLPDNNSWFNRVTVGESTGKTNLNAVTSVLYLVMSEPFRMYRSTDGGDGWTEIGRLPYGGSERNYAVAPNPTNADEVYVAGTSLYHSTDGGYSSESINLSTFEVRAISFAPSNPKVMYAATDNGMQVSSDGGYNWTLRNSGLSATQWHDAAIANDGAIYGAVQDYSILRYQNGNFTQSAWGEAREVAVDATDARGVYALAVDKGVGRSFDSGNVFSSANGNLPTDHSVLHALTADRVNSKTLYIAAGNKLYWTSNAGDEWFSLGDGSSVSNITAIAVEKVERRGVFVGRADGSVQMVTGFRTGAPVWITVYTPPSVQPVSVKSLTTSAGIVDAVFSSSSARAPLRIGLDGTKGVSSPIWIEAWATDLAIMDQNDPSNVYIGTYTGAWAVNNFNAAQATDLPSVETTSVMVDSSGTVYVSTWGRGLYKLVK